LVTQGGKCLYIRDANQGDGRTVIRKLQDLFTGDGFSVNDITSSVNGNYVTMQRTVGLATATASTLGGIKVGSGLAINNGVLSATGGGNGGDNTPIANQLPINIVTPSEVYLLDEIGVLDRHSYTTMVFRASTTFPFGDDYLHDTFTLFLNQSNDIQANDITRDVPHYITFANYTNGPIEIFIARIRDEIRDKTHGVIGRELMKTTDITDKKLIAEDYGNFTGNSIVIEPDDIVEISFVLTSFATNMLIGETDPEEILITHT
jgi:hypothetical protein